MRDNWFQPDAIARRLRRARGSRSQTELGRALGYLQPQVSRYERGDVPGSFRYLAGLAALFGADLNWVLTGRRAAAPTESTAEADDLEARIRRAVREALAEASTPWPAELTEPAASPEGKPLLSGGDRLHLDLPRALAPLLERSRSASAGGARSSVSTLDADLDALLDALQPAVRAGDVEGAADRLARTADRWEKSGCVAADFDRARVLRLWAWRLLESAAPVAARRRAPGALFRIARATRLAGRSRDAVPFYAAAIERADASGDREISARAHAGLGHVSFEAGDFAAARSHYVAALERALETGDPRLMIYAHLDLAACTHEQKGDYERALEHASAGLELARRLGDAEHEGRFLNEIGLNEMELGHLAAARERFSEALAVARGARSRLLRVIAWNNLADVSLREGRTDEAAALLSRSRTAARAAGWTWAELQAEILLARLEHGTKRSGAALERLERVVERATESRLSHELRRARALEREVRRSVIGRLEAVGA